MFSYLITLLTFAGSFSATSQPFEGSLKFLQSTVTDTSYYTYYVKDNLVRIDELNKNLKLERYSLINIQNKEVSIVDPFRKMYLKLPPQKKNHEKEKDYQIIKTENYKIIKGYTCYQWRVRNETKNTEICFWIAKDNFNFFDELISLLDNNLRINDYFMHIPANNGIIPFESVERTLLREMKSKLELIDLNKSSLSKSLFEIPKGFVLKEY